MIDKEGTQPYQVRYRWVMLALVSILYGAFGIVSGVLSPLVTPILKDLHISYSQMGIIMGGWQLTYIVVAVVGGTIMDRWGIRKSFFVGMVIIALSAGLRYFANGFATMLICVALFGVGGPMISIGAPKTASLWFKGKDRATAVGIYSTGSPIGGLIALSMTNSVIMPLTGYSWRLTFVVYGLLALAAAVLWLLLAKDVKAPEAKGATSTIGVFTKLISIRNVGIILTMGLLSMIVTHGLSRWLPKILENGGLSPTVAGFAASVPTLVGLPLALILPRVVPPRLRGRIIALMALIGAIPPVIVVIAHGAPLLLGLVILGTINWAGTPLMMLILMDTPEIGSQYMGSAGGLYFSVSEIGGFLGPSIMGTLHDWTGSFLIGACVLVGVRVIVAGIALLLRTEQPASDTQA